MQTAGLSSLYEFSKLIHTAAAEKLRECLTSRPEVKQRGSLMKIKIFTKNQSIWTPKH